MINTLPIESVDADVSVEAPTADVASGAAQWWLDAILHGYGQIVLAPSRRAGAGLLAASFVSPMVGSSGLLTMAASIGIARALGYDREALRSGALGANAALAGLWLGVFGHEPATIAVGIPVVAGTVAVAHAAITALFSRIHLPALSVPFTVVAATLHAAIGAPIAASKAAFDPLEALAALVFGASPLAGLCVAVGIVAWSRVAAVHAAVGLAVAGVCVGFGAGPAPLVGFNAVVVAIGLGGIFYVPGPATLGLAAIGAASAAVLVGAADAVLGVVGVPTLAGPLNLVILGTLLGLAQRNDVRGPRPVQVPRSTPEEVSSYDRTRIRRFQATLPVRLRLPFRGPWVCTQGNDGAHTHRGLWRHGLDFEVSDSDGRRHRGDGSRLDDWYAYRQPVAAMADGTVVAVVDGVPDHPVGDVDWVHNWGNAVVIRFAPDLYGVVAHLSPGSLRVVEGEVVRAGQIVGLCGNSGRSPVPHLHVQLQRTARIGDPTVPIAFADAVVGGASHAEHVPAEGEVVRNPGRDPLVTDDLAFPAGSTWILTTHDGAGVRRERVVSDINWLGHRSLVDPTTGARLWFDAGPEGFVAYDVAAPVGSALVALYAALARVRVDEGDLIWTDWVDPARLSRGVLPFVADVLAAFAPVGPQRATFVSHRSGSSRVIVGTVAATRPWHTPVRTRAVFRADRGPIEIDVAIGRRTARVTVEPA